MAAFCANYKAAIGGRSTVFTNRSRLRKRKGGLPRPLQFLFWMPNYFITDFIN
jgi:hypothetical protein